MFTQEYLNERLSYDPDTGILRWKPIPEIDGRDKAFNSRWAGMVAGNPDPKGYVKLTIDYKNCLAHRIIWMMVHGVLPKVVDHINRNTSDNRFINLRNASHSDNHCNSPKRPNNTSGFKGVFWESYWGKWRVRVQKDGKRIHVGYYPSAEQAYEAYADAAAKLHGEFACVE